MKKISKKFLTLITVLLLLITMLCGCYAERGNFVSYSDDDYTLEFVSDNTLDDVSQDEQSQADINSEEEIQSRTETASENTVSKTEKKPAIDKKGSYTSPEEVAEYIRTYKKLPGNFIKKKDAEKLGWVSSKGNLWEVTDHKSIGGDTFGNREGKLPKKNGRKWYECDVNYKGGYRGEERILYSNDGLIYYTDDHYETFTLME